MHNGQRILLLLIVLLGSTTPGRAQQGSTAADDRGGGIVTGSLAEIRNRRRLLLLVQRSSVVDSRGMAKTILSEAYRQTPEARSRYPRVFNTIARKINKYIRKYQSLTSVENLSDAEFIVVFNLLEIRRPLGYPYPYGEMFVILNDTAGGRQPRIIWKTRKTSVWVEDAIEDFIRDLKAARGES